MKKYISIFCLMLTVTMFSQQNNKSTLTIDQIMQAEKFVGYAPTNIFWSVDSKTIYFDWNPEQKPIRSLYKYSLLSKQVSKVSIAEEMNMKLSYDEDYNSDKTKKVFVKNGDIFLYNTTINTTKNLIITYSERESNVHFYNNDKEIVFNKNNNLFSLNLDEGTIKQLTNIKSGTASSKSKTADNKQD